MVALLRRIGCSLLTRLLVAFFLLGLAWLISTPPSGGVDEVSHYVRAVGLAHGQVIGADVDVDHPFEYFQGEQLRRINAESGWFSIPAKMPPPNDCNVLEVTRAYDCPAPAQGTGLMEAISLHGRSLPGAYVAPAAMTIFATGTVSATYLSRFGMLIQNLLLFAVILGGLRAIRRNSEPNSLLTSLPTFAVLGLSITPVLMFLSATMSPSSFETLSAAAFAASLIVAARSQSTKWLTWAVVLSVICSWSRDLGAVVVLIAVASVLVIEPNLRHWWREKSQWRWLPVVVVSLSIFSALLWQAEFKFPLQPDIGSPARLWSDIAVVFKILRQGIGLGGWLNTPLDPVLETLWFIGLISLVAISILRVSATVRLALLAQSALLLGVGVYLVSMLRVAGFGIQARFFMPQLAVMVILLVTSTQGSNGPEFSRSRRLQWRVLVAFIALAHGSALLISAHRQARGINGSSIDFGKAQWAPPGGWALPGVIAVVGMITVATLPFPNLKKTPVTLRPTPVS